VSQRVHPQDSHISRHFQKGLLKDHRRNASRFEGTRFQRRQHRTQGEARSYTICAKTIAIFLGSTARGPLGVFCGVSEKPLGDEPTSKRWREDLLAIGLDG